MPFTFRRLVAPCLGLAVAATLTATVPSTAVTPTPTSAPTAAIPAAPTPAPTVGSAWTVVDAATLPARRDGLARLVAPREFVGLHLDVAAFTARMARSTGTSTTIVDLPTPEGGSTRFRIEPTRTMQAGLAAQHPEIATYAGVSIDGPPSTVRLDSTVAGVHAMVRDGEDSWFVEPAYVGPVVDDALYISYRTSDLPARPHVEEMGERVRDQYAAFNREHADRVARVSARRAGEDETGVVQMREFRLAMTTDPTYAAKSLPATNPPTDAPTINQFVTGAKATLTNRVNDIYNADVAFNLVLVNDNDKLNLNNAALFSTANGPCGATACFANSSDCSDLLDSNKPVVGQIIGADKFDIGHLSMGEGFGGVAYLGVVGEDDKAGGCTSLTAPYGDGFAIDFVAHEMGHQFSGNHTFDGVNGSCMSTNRNAGTSVEPGSGTSVMAYAGICSSDDTQPHTDPYFSQRTQDEFTARTTAPPTTYDEEQKFVLRNFDGTDSFRLAFAGKGTTVPIASGAGFTTAAVDQAITTVLEGNPTVSALSANGFTVTYDEGEEIALRDIPTPTVEVASGTFTGFGNAIVNGGDGTNQGFRVTTGANHRPTVTVPETRTIPIRTPFELTGAGADADADELVYLWEQNDIGGATGSVLITSQRTYGPLFRIFGTYADVPDATTSPAPGINLATTSPTRTFPDIEQIIAGTTNAETGTCPAPPEEYVDPTAGLPASAALDCYSELLPMAGYQGDGPYVPTPLDEGFPDVVPPRNPLGMRFRLTARDLGGVDGGVDGGYGFGEVVLDIDPTSGPFLVTSQGTAATVDGGKAGTIEWDTALTDVNGLADDVRITLSTDGGRTYPITVLETTPNDGSQEITWPNIDATKVRVKVAAVDNYFFDISDADIAIKAAPGLTLGGNATGTVTVQHSDAPAPTIVVTASSATKDGGAITATAAGLPAGLTLTKVSSSAAGVRPGTARFEIAGTATGDAASSPVVITVNDGAAPAATATFTAVVTKEAATPVYTGPTRASASQGGTDAVTLTLTADVTEQADGALGGLTQTTATFSDTSTGESLCTGTVANGRASCQFGADLTGTADRTYRVAVTLGGNRYAGATAQPTNLVVTYDEGLVVNGPVSSSGAQYTDAPAPAVAVDISDRFVESSSLTATATGLPSGLALTRTSASGAGVLPGRATYTVTGTATAAPGSYPVTITVLDGKNAPVSRQTTVIVTREDASVAYTGPATVAAGATETSKQFTMTARVTDLGTGGTDTTRGDVTTATVTFTDTATGTVLCNGAAVTLTSPGVGSASCPVTATFPADDERTYRVALTVGGRYVGGSSGDTAVTVDQAEVGVGDTTAPETTITSGPGQGSIVLPRDISVGYASSEPGSTFTCSLNGRSGTCPAAADGSSGTVNVRSLGAGAFDVRVAATDAAGNADTSPATRRFYVPANDRDLTVASGTWRRKRGADAFRGTYSEATRAGAELRYAMPRSTSLALVVTKGPGLGAVEVFLGNRRLSTVSLGGSARTQVVVGVARFASPTSGTVRVVTRSAKPVRIEGIAPRPVEATARRTHHHGVALV